MAASERRRFAWPEPPARLQAVGPGRQWVHGRLFMQVRISAHLAFMASVAVILVAWAQVGNPRPMTLEVDGVARSVETRQIRVDDFLKEQRIAFAAGDSVAPPLGASLAQVTTVQVQRGVPVTVIAGGEARSLTTTAWTIQGALNAAGVAAGPFDTVTLNGAPVVPGRPLSARRLQLNGIGQGRSLTVNPASSEDPAPGDAAPSASVIELRPARTIFVHASGAIQEVPTLQQTVGETLRSAGFAVGPSDLTFPPSDQEVNSGLHVFVRQAKAMPVRVDGGDRLVYTFEPTVGQALRKAGIAVSPVDRISPDPSSAITSNTRVTVVRISQERLTKTETIAFQTQYVPDGSLEIDQVVSAQAGADGKRVRAFLVGYENGVEVQRTVERDSVEQAPQARVIHYGTKPVYRTLATPSGPIQYWRKMRVYATWYHPGSAGKPLGAPGYGITSLGLEVQRGVIAVDPRVIPYRTQMYVPGYGMGVAGDTGGAIRGNMIDLGFSDDEDHDWTTRWIDIYITGPAPDPSQIKPPA